MKFVDLTLLVMLTGAQWQMVAVEPRSGKELAAERNVGGKGALVPASLMKLFTAGAVLERDAAGGRLDMSTRLFHDGSLVAGVLRGSLYLAGRGNGFLSEMDIQQLALSAKKTGIREIAGDVVTDETAFDPVGLERTRSGPGHAPAGALGLDLHTVSVTVSPTAPGKPPRVAVAPAHDSVRVAVAALTTATMVPTVRITQLDDATYRVAGNIPLGSAPVKQRFALRDPALYAGHVLATALREAGIELKGKVRKGKTPEGAALVAEAPGPPLKELVRKMNVNSLNVVADNLLMLLGAETYGNPGTREKGVKVLREFLTSPDLSLNEVTIVDGSGLSEQNRVTGRFMASYLAKVSHKPWFPAFRDSLPRPGFDGTVKEIGYKDERFRVKSGRLENAFAVAGYGKNDQGRDFTFAYIVNAPHGEKQNLERSGAEVMRYLAHEAFP